jgi:hypothetical protein
MTAKGREIGNNRFFTLGKVSTFKGGRIAILRKVGSQSYRPYKFTRTKKATGKFRTRIAQAGNNRTCFKVVAPETETYRETEKAVGCIVNG